MVTTIIVTWCLPALLVYAGMVYFDGRFTVKDLGDGLLFTVLGWVSIVLALLQLYDEHSSITLWERKDKK